MFGHALVGPVYWKTCPSEILSTMKFDQIFVVSGVFQALDNISESDSKRYCARPRRSYPILYGLQTGLMKGHDAIIRAWLLLVHSWDTALVHRPPRISTLAAIACVAAAQISLILGYSYQVRFVFSSRVLSSPFFFSLPPTRDSDPAPHTAGRLSSPLPATTRAFIFIATRFSHFLPPRLESN